MTTPQGPRKDGPSGWARPGDQGPLGRPPAPGNPYGGRPQPGDPRGGPGPQNPPPSSQPTENFALGNASTRRISQPQPPGPTAGQATPTASPTNGPAEVKKKKKRSLRDPLSIVLVLIIVLAIVVAGGIFVELYVRNEANNKIASATACKVKDDVTASFGVTPLVTYQWLTDHYTNISIETAGNQIQDAKGMKLQIDLRDVKLEETADSKGTIGAIDATLSWTTAGIQETVQNLLPVVKDFVKTSVTSHPNDQTLEFKGIASSLVVKPTVKDGGLELQIVSFNVLGFKVPKETVQSSLDEYTQDLTKKLPLGIKADSVNVTDSGVVVKFLSRNATIPAGETDPCFANL